MQKILKQPPLKIRGSMTLSGDLDQALVELKKEKDQSLERLITGLTGFASPTKSEWRSKCKEPISKQKVDS